MLRRMFWLFLVMLMITPVAAQQQTPPLWRALTSTAISDIDSANTWLAQIPSPHAVLFSRSLLPESPNSRPMSADLANAPVYQKHTGVLVLLDASDPNALLQVLSGITSSDTELNALIGNYASLQKILQQRELFFWQLPLWTLIINFCSAFVLLVLHNKQSNLTQSSWLIACALLGNMYFIQQLSSIDLPPLAINICISVWLYLLCRLALATQQQPHTRPLDWLLGVVLILQLITSLTNNILFAAVVITLYSLSLLVINTRIILLKARQLDAGSQVLLAAVSLVSITVVADSILLASGFSLDAHPGMQLQLVPFAQIAGVLAALYFLVNQHADTQLELRNLNESLDTRVKSASEELQSRYQQLVKDALDADSMRERKSIYQSIHEDLSDKLLQLFYSANDKDTADLARTALAELRDSHSLTPDHKRALADVLADAHTEIQQRCDQAGVSLQWQQDTQLGDCLVSARQSSAVSRTLREAFSNLLKHANASRVCVEFTINAHSHLAYRVNDNGVGLIANARPGRGLVNMQSRISELGGTLIINSPPSGGTALEFTLPLDTQETSNSFGLTSS